jgi:hypothetical protein
MLNQITQLKAQTPFVMDDIMYFHVDQRLTRKKEQDENKLLAHLRMAALVSKNLNPGTDFMENPQVLSRLNDLLSHVRFHSPTLRFHDKYTRNTSELIPGVYLSMNHACTKALLIRDIPDNLAFLSVKGVIKQ